MAFEFEVHERIDRPVEEVFAYVSAVENAPEWHPAITESTMQDDEMVEGARWTETYESPFGASQLREKCIAYDPPNRWGYETLNGLLGGRIRTTEAIWHFADEEGATAVTIAGTTQVTGLLRVLQPLFRRVVIGELESQLEELKTTMESTTE